MKSPQKHCFKHFLQSVLRTLKDFSKDLYTKIKFSLILFISIGLFACGNGNNGDSGNGGSQLTTQNGQTLGKPPSSAHLISFCQETNTFHQRFLQALQQLIRQRIATSETETIDPSDPKVIEMAVLFSESYIEISRLLENLNGADYDKLRVFWSQRINNLRKDESFSPGDTSLQPLMNHFINELENQINICVTNNHSTPEVRDLLTQIRTQISLMNQLASRLPQ